MRFGVLGSVTVVDDRGEPVDVGGAQSRTVLAALLVAAGRVVTADTLIDTLWGEAPPASALGTLQSYVSRLRRAMEPGRAPGGTAAVLRWEPPGYRLAVDPGDVDFRRFEALADEGRALLAAGRAAEARERLVEADQLWRGPALVEYRDREFAQGLVARLEDRRVAALVDRAAADLALGRHGAVAGELAELVAAHPLREELRAHLALALYRSGRQAEALRALADARRVLREELGVDPSRALQDLEAAILAQDPALDAHGPGPTPADQPAHHPAPAGGRAASGPAAAVAERLVGRAEELAGLRAALEEAATTTRFALVEGEPGIGKTRLAEEVARLAAGAGARVLWGRTFEGDGAPALWPWLPALRALAASRPPGEGLPAELANLLSPAGTAADAPARPDAARFALVEAVADLIAGAAARQRLVLVLDDLQWADQESLGLLGSLAGRLADVPLLVVVTLRELEVGRNDAVVDTLATLTRRGGTRRIRLGGLGPDDTAALVAQTTGAPAAPASSAAIHARAEGNPFFTTELARLLASGGGLPAGDVPGGVRDVVRRRLGLLPGPTVELLRVAAVIGRDAEIGLLSRAAGRDLGDCLDDLEPALVHRVVNTVDGAPGTFRFAHALVREVVVADLSALRRARLHLQVADALDDADDTAEILAEHLWQAVPIGVGRRAAAALERAATVALRRLSFSSAQDLLERAVQLRRSAAASRDDQAAELDAIMFLASVVGAREGYAALTRSPLVERGKQLAIETGSTMTLLNLLWSEWAGYDTSCLAEQADPIAWELLARAEATGLPVAEVLGHTAVGISLWHRGAIVESAHHLDRAAAMARTIPPGTLSSVLVIVDQVRLPAPFSTYVHDLIGDLSDPEARYEEVRRLVPDDRYWDLVVANFEASGALSSGDLARAERAGRRGLVADPDGIFTFWSSALRCYLGATMALAGALDEGLGLLDEAWARYSATGLRTNGLTMLSCRAQALAQGGRLDEARVTLGDAHRELATYGERYAEPTLLLADAAVARAGGDDPARVRATLARAAALATSQGSHAVARHVVASAARMGVELTG